MPDDRRETADHEQSAPIEGEPASAAIFFGDRIDETRRYVQILANAGIERGLIGPRETSRLWSRHVLNCAVLAELVPPNARVVDVGSGAGLPGICLALARPDLRIDLVEPLLRRATFLREVTAELNLASCRVVRARAEEAISDVGGADIVTSRAVAPLAKLARWSAPLLRVDGRLMALKGASAPDEVERDRTAVAKAGLVDLVVQEVGAAVTSEIATVVIGRRVADSVGADGKRDQARPRTQSSRKGRRR